MAVRIPRILLSFDAKKKKNGNVTLSREDKNDHLLPSIAKNSFLEGGKSSNLYQFDANSHSYFVLSPIKRPIKVFSSKQIRIIPGRREATSSLPVLW